MSAGCSASTACETPGRRHDASAPLLLGNNDGMTDRHLTDQLADLVVFAPLGLALTALERIPDLAATGRQAMEGRLATARVVGEMAVRQAGHLGEQLVQKGRSVAGTGHRDSGPVAGDGIETPPLAPESPPLAAEAPDLVEASPASLPPDASVPPSVPALAIPGYDTLSAYQVVQRLEGLSAAELEEVRRHEESGRGRQTILNRIAQLSAAS